MPVDLQEIIGKNEADLEKKVRAETAAYINVKCDVCGKDVKRWVSHLSRNKHTYCSKECRSLDLTRNPNTTCPVCQKTILCKAIAVE